MSRKIHKIRHFEDLDAALALCDDHPVVLYKHSITCGLSFRARREVEAFVSASEVPVYEIVVQEARPVSNAVASRFHVRHESPQVITLYKGAPMYDASHWRITADALHEAISILDA